MKKKINHILPALVLTASLGLTTVSCNGFLDEMPDNPYGVEHRPENSQTACIGVCRRVAQRTFRALQR